MASSSSMRQSMKDEFEEQCKLVLARLTEDPDKKVARTADDIIKELMGDYIRRWKRIHLRMEIQRRLESSGFSEKISAVATEQLAKLGGTDNCTPEELVEATWANAKSSIPLDIKRDMVEVLKNSLKSEMEIASSFSKMAGKSKNS